MRKLFIAYKQFTDGRRGVELASPCPNGKDCMIGSAECSRCKGYSKRGMGYRYIKCKIDKPSQLK